jgi:hypothetical protein
VCWLLPPWGPCRLTLATRSGCGSPGGASRSSAGSMWAALRSSAAGPPPPSEVERWKVGPEPLTGGLLTGCWLQVGPGLGCYILPRRAVGCCLGRIQHNTGSRLRCVLLPSLCMQRDNVVSQCASPDPHPAAATLGALTSAGDISNPFPAATATERVSKARHDCHKAVEDVGAAEGGSEARSCLLARLR